MCSVGDIPMQPRSNLNCFYYMHYTYFIIYCSDSRHLMSSLMCVLAFSQAGGLLKVQAAAQNEQPNEKIPACILTQQCVNMCKVVLFFHHLLQAHRCVLTLKSFRRIKKIFLFPPMSCAEED